ncbi:MAG: oligosaccharide flippase family protein [SAR324 cluster bacterium]|nr:oligosaccharide flippase family protein [SAR324 cluster bacterium]
MSLFSKFVTAGAFISFETGCNSIFTILTAALTFRIVTVEEFGVIALVQSSAGVIGLIVGALSCATFFGVEIPKKIGEKDDEKVKFLLYTSFFLTLILTELMLGIVFFVNDVFLKYPQISFYYLFLLLSLNTSLFQGHIELLFGSYLLFGKRALFRIVITLARFFIIAGLYFFPNFTATPHLWVLYSYPLSICIALIFIFPFVIKLIYQLKDIPLVAREKFVFIKDSIKHIKYIILISITKKIQDDAPIWLLQFFLGTVSVGLYSAAQKVVNIVFTGLRLIETLIVPFLSQISYDTSKRNRVSNVIAKYMFWLSVFFSIGLIICMDPIVNLILTNQFENVTLISQIFTLILVAYSLTSVQRPLLYTLNLYKQMNLILMISTIFILLAGSLSIQYWGVLGMVTALVVQRYLEAVLSYICITKVSPSDNINISTFFKITSDDKKVMGYLKSSLGRV